MARETLKALSRKQPGLGEIFDIFHALSTEADRAMTILACAQIENALEGAIESRLIATLSENDRARLFEGDNPISTFSAKIKVGFALGIYGHETRADLNCVRDIRNAFAHSRIAISFKTEPVAEACKTLNAPRGLGTEDKYLWEPRDRYYRATNQLVVNLLEESQQGVPNPVSVLP